MSKQGNYYDREHKRVLYTISVANAGGTDANMVENDIDLCLKAAIFYQFSHSIDLYILLRQILHVTFRILQNFAGRFSQCSSPPLRFTECLQL